MISVIRLHCRLRTKQPVPSCCSRACTVLSTSWVLIEVCLTPCATHLQAVKPRDFAMQINLSMENCWGIVRALVDVCSGLEDGKWLLVKDPNKPLLRLYSVPADAFKVCEHCLP